MLQKINTEINIKSILFWPKKSIFWWFQKINIQINIFSISVIESDIDYFNIFKPININKNIDPNIDPNQYSMLRVWKAATLDAKMTGKVVLNTAEQCQDGQPGLCDCIENCWTMDISLQSNSNGIQKKKENQETQILMHGSDP